MAFVDSYSFSHRFSDDKWTDSTTANHQEVVVQCHEASPIALTRMFFQFALGCGFSPSNIIEAMDCLSREYGEAYCGFSYDKESLNLDHGAD